MKYIFIASLFNIVNVLNYKDLTFNLIYTLYIGKEIVVCIEKNYYLT
jgi:hypothetical protein